MKTVYKTSEIAHLWVNQTQSHARNPQGNLYFRDSTIYSYGAHFPIAQHVTNKRGEKGVLLTTAGYSPTTSRHVADVRHAIHGATVIHVDKALLKGSITTKQGLEVWSNIVEYHTKACYGPTGRFRKTAWDELAKQIDRANKYAEFFGYAERWELPANTDKVKEAIARDQARAAKALKARQAAHDKQVAARLVKQTEALEAWRNGENVSTYDIGYDLPIALRLRDGQVETSRGAVVPVLHATRLLDFVKHVRTAGEPYHRNGHTFHVGPYAVDSIATDGTVTAGCHIITWSEIERFEVILNG